VEFLRRQLQIDKEKMHLLEETMENLKNQGLINAGKKSIAWKQRSITPTFSRSRVWMWAGESVSEG